MLNRKLGKVSSLVCTLGNSNIAITIRHCKFESVLVWKHLMTAKFDTPPPYCHTSPAPPAETCQGPARVTEESWCTIKSLVSHKEDLSRHAITWNKDLFEESLTLCSKTKLYWAWDEDKIIEKHCKGLLCMTVPQWIILLDVFIVLVQSFYREIIRIIFHRIGHQPKNLL